MSKVEKGLNCLSQLDIFWIRCNLFFSLFPRRAQSSNKQQDMKKVYPQLKLLWGVLLLSLVVPLPAQQFLNSDLNGTVTTSGSPTSWQQVPFTDPNSNASGTPQATSDVTSLSGPLSGAGINGNPYSGATFVCGLMMSMSGSYWHEGLMQTVSGFTVGQVYNIRFYQTVVKQSNALDQSGGWLVIRDNTQLQTTAPSFSTLPYNSNSLVWQQRDVSFTATSTTHTFKFLPMDDDPIVNSSTQGVRMGIDQISLTTTAVLSWEAELDLSPTPDRRVQLNWEMPQAEYAETFHVERSRDGQEFEHVTTVGAGYPGNYQAIDHFPHDMTYYRLAQVDRNGSVRYSKINSIQLDIDFDAVVVGRRLVIRGAEPGECDAYLFDLAGRQVFLKEDAELEEMLSALSKGIYVLRVVKGEQLVQKKIALE